MEGHRADKKSGPSGCVGRHFHDGSPFNAEPWSEFRKVLSRTRRKVDRPGRRHRSRMPTLSARKIDDMTWS